jgi:hypothetical protein
MRQGWAAVRPAATLILARKQRPYNPLRLCSAGAATKSAPRESTSIEANIQAGPYHTSPGHQEQGTVLYPMDRRTKRTSRLPHRPQCSICFNLASRTHRTYPSSSANRDSNIRRNTLSGSKCCHELDTKYNHGRCARAGKPLRPYKTEDRSSTTCAFEHQRTSLDCSD